MTHQAELLPGTLDLLILEAVSLGDVHGYSVLLRIERIPGGARPPVGSSTSSASPGST